MPIHGYAGSISGRAALRIAAAAMAAPEAGYELAKIRSAQEDERNVGNADNCEDPLLFVLDHPVLGRLDTAGSELFMPADENDDELSVGTHFRSQPWITTNDYPQDFPFHALLGGGEDDGGEVVRVVGISGAGLEQTFSVVRGINGVQHQWLVGTAVQLSNWEVCL